jgi:hypothetical protein
MITFRDFLEEALKPSLYRPLVKGWDSKRLENIFKSSPLEKDRRAFRLYFQFPQEEIKVEPNPVVTAALKDLGYDIDDYKLGLAIKDRRKIKIGGVLSKNPAALKIYVEDPARAGTQKKYEGVISRHPYDIAAMSTHRGWTSCQDFIESPKMACEYVPADIQAGTLIAYMIKAGDRDIKSPVGRILIKPYLNEKDETGYAIARISYGVVTDEFKKEVENFVSWINRQRGLKGLFQISSGVYQGGDAFKNALVGDYSEEELIELVKINPLFIKLIKDPNETIQLIAVRKNSNAIMHIKNPTEKVQLEAIRDDLDLIGSIENPTEKVQLEVVKGSINLFVYIKNPTEKTQLEVVKKNPYRIGSIIDQSEAVQLAAISKKLDSIRYIYNPTETVQLEVIKKDPNWIKSIKNPTETVQLEVIKKDPNLIKSIKNPSPRAIQLSKELQGK